MICFAKEKLTLQKTGDAECGTGKHNDGSEEEQDVAGLPIM